MELALADDIQAAALLDDSRAIVLTTSGVVGAARLGSGSFEQIFDTNPPKNVHYSDGGFDSSAASSVYVMGEIVVVVNDYKTNGFVLNQEQDYVLRLHRDDYYAEISQYPIALFRGTDGDPYLIYGTAWNRVDIANLTTRQVLTADKSLIEVGAEQHHLDFYSKHTESNKFLWPSEYDYFYGHLAVSPNRRRFLSAGWWWGSSDCCATYDIGDFTASHRINACHIGYWEHHHRPVCFVDDDTVAVPVNPARESDGPDVWQIQLYRADDQGQFETLSLDEPLDLCDSKYPLPSQASIVYHADSGCFYAFSKTLGLVVRL